MWVFVVNIINGFILGLDILRAYDAAVDLGHQTLRLAEEVIITQPRPSSLVVTKDQVIPAQCEGIVMARLESPFRVENGLVEPSPEAHLAKALYIGRTLVQDRREVPVRVLNTARRDQLMKGSPWHTVSQSCW
jgi:hypothetical protein